MNTMHEFDPNYPRPSDTPKFTPPPWGCRISESGAIAIFNAEGTWIATTLRKQWPKEDRANAYLIAAAPDGYALAEAIVALDSSPLQRDHVPTAIRDMAHALLAKVQP